MSCHFKDDTSVRTVIFQVHYDTLQTSFPLTRVKELRVFPFLLIMVQRPQVDDDSSSFPHREIPNAIETHKDTKER